MNEFFPVEKIDRWISMHAEVVLHGPPEGVPITALPVTVRAVDVAFRNFEILQNSYIGFLGVVDLVFHGFFAHRRVFKDGEQKDQALFDRIRQAYATAHYVRGICHLGAFILGTGTAIHKYTHGKEMPVYVVAKVLGNTCALLAHVVTLKNSCEQYWEATEALHRAENKSDDKEIERAHYRQWTAVMCIISAVGYLLTTLLSVLGAATTLALVLGGIAATTGFVKVCYDFHFRWNHA